MGRKRPKTKQGFSCTLSFPAEREAAAKKIVVLLTSMFPLAEVETYLPEGNQQLTRIVIKLR